MEQNKNTVILIDDDALVRQSLKSILSAKGYDVVATGKDGKEAIELYFKHMPNIILMDIRMANTNGLGATREILNRHKDAKILLVTTFHDKEYIDEAMRLGCKGYILKENISGISGAIQSILNDKIVYDRQVMETIIDENLNKTTTSVPTSQNSPALQNLSQREKEVLQLVANGMNNKEISSELFLSEGTVRNYISVMLSKLELRDRTQLAIYYYKNNV